jgi:hypothetical protein
VFAGSEGWSYFLGLQQAQDCVCCCGQHLPGQHFAFFVQQALPPMAANADSEKSDVARRAKIFVFTMSSFPVKGECSRAEARRRATS